MGRKLRYLPYDRTLVEITSRTIHSRYLLKPTKKMRQIVLGALGRAQRLYDVEIHAFCFMSNHYHLLISVRDEDQMAGFLCYFQSNLAREIARLTGWRDKIWARRYTDVVVSNAAEDQIARLDYILSHGVKEGLVLHPAEWPGAHCVEALLHGVPLEGLWFDRSAEYEARRSGRRVDPDAFAEQETVEISPLPCWEGKPTAWIREQVRGMIDAIIERARSDGRRYWKLMKKIRPTDRPQRSKRSPAPLFHCASRSERRKLERAYREFVAAYREAAAHWLRGELTAPFPDGCFPPPRRLVTK